jgi:hypothetical protein
MKQSDLPIVNPEPRWPAMCALLAVGGTFLALPKNLVPGLNWAPILIVVILGGVAWAAHTSRLHRVSHILSHLVNVIVTGYLVIALGLLIHALPHHTESSVQLLTSAALLWITNIIVFGSWYWRLDAGGPHKRERRPEHTDGAFLFPQMALSGDIRGSLGLRGWSPQFLDYLFLAFSTSTALSSADTFPLNRWAKVMMMAQSLISLSIIALLAARSVNIL